MRLVCLSNRGSTLSDHQRPRGTTDRSTYPLTPGRSYLVVGMLLWENVLSYLVPDDGNGPCYAPVELFNLGTWRLPPDWTFGCFSGLRASGRDLWTDPYQAAWGYDEFVRDEQHGVGLAEREESALAVFARRVREAELDSVRQERPANEGHSCPVCGYDAAESPWGEDGRTPNFAYCPCCGVEWGYQDSSPAGVERFRAQWLAAGAPWRDRKESHDGLEVAERLRRIGVTL